MATAPLAPGGLAQRIQIAFVFAWGLLHAQGPKENTRSAGQLHLRVWVCFRSGDLTTTATARPSPGSPYTELYGFIRRVTD